ncbi:MAG: IPExxxVDY family protein [Prevotellaceae bacterium]|jgi:hypothetical protein|nr:IPExxxVDY family protein [Prevotellaceae bacterium]
MAKKTGMAKKSKGARSFLKDDVSFSLLAICSAEPDTRMAWLLNRALHLDFVHRCDVCGEEARRRQEQPLLDGSGSESDSELGEPQQFAIFCAVSSIVNRTYILITNRQNSKTLIREFAHVDYLLKVPEALPTKELAKLGAAIRAIPGVLACITVAGNFKYSSLLASLEL